MHAACSGRHIFYCLFARSLPSEEHAKTLKSWAMIVCLSIDLAGASTRPAGRPVVDWIIPSAGTKTTKMTDDGTATTTTTGRENNKKADRGGAEARWLLPSRAIAPLMTKEWDIHREIEMDFPQKALNLHGHVMSPRDISAFWTILSKLVQKSGKVADLRGQDK